MMEEAALSQWPGNKKRKELEPQYPLKDTPPMS
jgi:hypothetical protein